MSKTVLIVPVLLAAVAVAVVAVLRMDPTGTRGPRTGSRYAEEVRASSTIDPSRIAWEESATPMAIEMDSPCGIAVDDTGRVCVVGDRLVVLTADGAPVVRSEELAREYRALDVAGDGRFVAAGADSVDVIGLVDGRANIVRSVEIPGDGVDLTGVAVSTEWIFVADAGRNRVLRLPIEPAGDGAPFEVVDDGFFVPSTMDLTVSPVDELFTVDPGRHRVQLRDRYGDVVRAFGQLGTEVADFHGCCNPVAIAVTEGGQIVTAEKGLAATRVKVYAPDGELDSVVAGPDRFDERPDGPPIVLDVAVDPAGRVLVLDPARRQVRVFERRSR